MGSKGLILKYDGTAWTPEQSGTTASLYSVAAINNERAYAAGGDALFYRDEDGWRKIADIPGAGRVQALSSDKAWVFAGGRIYLYDMETGLVSSIPVVPTIYSYSLSSTASLWFIVGNTGPFDVYYCIGDTPEISKHWETDSSYFYISPVSIFALDDNHVWVIAHLTPYSKLMEYWQLWYWDGIAWSEGDNYEGIWGVIANSAGEAFAIGAGVSWVDGIYQTLIEPSLLEVHDVFPYSKDNFWYIDDHSILHYDDWPTDKRPMGVKISAQWTMREIGYYNYVYDIIAKARIQPMDQVCDVYILTRTPRGELLSLLPDNQLVPGLRPYAIGVGPLSLSLQETVYSTTVPWSSNGTYTIGIGLVPTGTPLRMQNLLGWYVGTFQ